MSAIKHHYFSVPTIVELTDESSWSKIGNRSTEFFIMRLHFMIKVRELNQVPVDGGILNTIELPADVKQERVVSTEVEKEYVNFEETLSSSSIDHESTIEIATGLKIGMGELLKFETELAPKVIDKVKTNITEVFKSGSMAKTVKNVKITTTTSFGGSNTDRLYQVKQYQKCAFDIYLTYMDYLYVDYITSFWGMRRKRVKFPKINSRLLKKRKNVVKINKPILCIHFWKLIESSVYKKASEYVNCVPDPNEYKVCPPEDLKSYYVQIPKEVSSLYKLSNFAFPLKWNERLIEDGPTPEQLKMIEEEDYAVKWGRK